MHEPEAMYPGVGERLWWISKDGKKRGSIQIQSIEVSEQSFIYLYEGTRRIGRLSDIGTRFFYDRPQWDHLKHCYTTEHGETEETEAELVEGWHTIRELWREEKHKGGALFRNVKTGQAYYVCYVNPDQTRIVFGKRLGEDNQPHGIQEMLPGWNRHQWEEYRQEITENEKNADDQLVAQGKPLLTDNNTEERPMLQIGTQLWYVDQTTQVCTKVRVAALSMKKREVHFNLGDELRTHPFSDVGKCLFLQNPTVSGEDGTTPHI